MPNIFKALASITVWILWLSGLVMGFSTLIVGILAGHLFSTSEVEPMAYPISFAVALAYAIGAVVVMVLRKKMELKNLAFTDQQANIPGEIFHRETVAALRV